jgi:hypothetical protein
VAIREGIRREKDIMSGCGSIAIDVNDDKVAPMVRRRYWKLDVTTNPQEDARNIDEGGVYKSTSGPALWRRHPNYLLMHITYSHRIPTRSGGLCQIIREFHCVF